MPKASLIIPTLDRQEFVRALVKTLAAQTEQDFETIIIDQTGSPDTGLKTNADASGGKLRYIHLTRKSLPNARNAAAQAATTDLLVFIDDDVELSPAFVAAHVGRFADSSVAAVAGRITGGYDDGPPGETCVGSYNRWTGTCKRNFHTTLAKDSIDTLPGGNFSVRRSIFLALDGFDVPVNPGQAGHIGGPAAHGEETDFSLRMKKAGHRIAFEPQAHLVHLRLERGGCRDESRTRWTWWHAHNMAVLARRHQPWFAWPVFLWIQPLRYLAHALKGTDPRLWFAGVTGTLTGFFAAKRASGIRAGSVTAMP